MKMPGFCAENALYQPTRIYAGASASLTSSGVVPALPSCSTCNWAWDHCEACLDQGHPVRSCPWCRILPHCSGACGPGEA